MSESIVNEQASILCAYSLDGNGSGTPLHDLTSAKVGTTSSPVWIHLNANAPATEAWLSDVAHLPNATLVTALLAPDTRPRILTQDQGVLLILRGVNLNDNADPEDMVSIRIWMEETRFISVQLRNLKGVDEMRHRLQSGDGPTDVGDLITGFIESSINRLSPVVDDLIDGIDAVEDCILQMEIEGLRDIIVSMRRKSIIFHRFLMPQQKLIGQLVETKFAWLTAEHRRRLLEAQNHVIRFVEELQAVKDRAQAVQDEIANILSARLNRTTYLFSLIAAIFLPLSFLTGLLGINVAGIPGSSDPNAFLLVCGILVAVVLVQIAIFKKLSWF